MRRALTLAVLFCALAGAQAQAAKEAPVTPAGEEVQSDISTRDIAIESNFTGIEILLYGSIDFSQTPSPETGAYDVIMVIRSPVQPLILRRKERMAGIWVNGPGEIYPAAPGFYAALSTRPFRAITSDETLKKLRIGFGNLDLGQTASNASDERFRSALIRLKEKQRLYQEHDDGVSFVGRSLFRATVELPVNVPIGRYTTDIYLFRDGAVISQNRSTIEVTKVGFEGVVYRLAYAHPFLYGVLAVAIAVLAGLAGWYAFRREGT